MFRNVPCTDYSPRGGVESYGMRCTGTNQECILPWYTKWDGYYNHADLQICKDKSDQIFTIGLTCREDLQKHFDFHDDHYCTSEYPRYPYIQNEPICTNKTEHISMYPEATTYCTDDPHHCHVSHLALVQVLTVSPALILITSTAPSLVSVSILTWSVTAILSALREKMRI